MLSPGRCEIGRGRPPDAAITYRSGLPARNEVNASSPPDGDQVGRMFCDERVTCCVPPPSQSITNRSRRFGPVEPEKAMREAKKLSSPVKYFTTSAAHWCTRARACDELPR